MIWLNAVDEFLQILLGDVRRQKRKKKFSFGPQARIDGLRDPKRGCMVDRRLRSRKSAKTVEGKLRQFSEGGIVQAASFMGAPRVERSGTGRAGFGLDAPA